MSSFKISRSLMVASWLQFALLFFATSSVYADALNDAKSDYESANYSVAFKKFMPLAESGNAEAQQYVCTMYLTGYGVKPDYAAAMHWCSKSASQGDSVAQYRLGAMYDQGVGVEENDVKAMTWYEKSAEQGMVVAMVNLGRLYIHGEKIEKDYQKAILLFKQAANKGYTLGWASLGYMYENGFGVQKDYRKAIQLYRKDYSDKVKEFYRDLARKMPCEQTAVVELLGLPLMCADREQVRTTLKKLGMTRVAVGKNRIIETYAASPSVWGIKELTIYYTSSKDAAAVSIVESRLATTTTVAAHEKQFKDIYEQLVEKYGRPEVGEYWSWLAHDGVDISLHEDVNDEKNYIMRYVVRF